LQLGIPANKAKNIMGDPGVAFSDVFFFSADISHLSFFLFLGNQFTVFSAKFCIFF